MKGLKYILLFIAVIIYTIVISGFISEKRKGMTVKELVVTIKNESKWGLLGKKDIEEIILKNGNIKGKSIKDIDLKNIENLVLKNKSLQSAETYLTEDGKLHIVVAHRIPLVRVCDRNNRNFYLDADGNIIPLTRHVSPLVLFANGMITVFPEMQKNNNINIEGKTNKYIVNQLLELCKYINENDFWRSQIVQIYVNDRLEFELVPRIGAHIILLGKIENYEEKLANLKVLYNEYFNKAGWNDYVHINLKYKDQIICTKR